MFFDKNPLCLRASVANFSFWDTPGKFNTLFFSFANQNRLGITVSIGGVIDFNNYFLCQRLIYLRFSNRRAH